MQLRDYQLEAGQAAAEAFIDHKSALLVLCTGAGKSLIISYVVSRMRKKKMRILILCHQAEILQQNFNAIAKLNKVYQTIYAASLGLKDLTGDVVLATRDSLGRRDDIPHFDAIIIDEAHLISNEENSFYQRIFKKIGAKYILGLTGTPFRSDGKIWGKDKTFEMVAYNVGIDDLVERGYLSPYIFPQKNTVLIDTSNVPVKRNGEFDEEFLEKTSMQVIASCVQTWYYHAKDRVCTIFFCCSIAHAKAVTEHLTIFLKHNEIGYIDGTTKDREQFFKNAKLGKYKALVNVGVLTTGIDIPLIDCVCMLRATTSPSLFVQSIGRGLRLAENKKNVLILDMTDNFLRFGSFANPRVIDKKLKKNKDEKPFQIEVGERLKQCPDCKATINAGHRSCHYCGAIFISHNDKTFDDIDKFRKLPVKHIEYEESITKKGDPCIIMTMHVNDYMYETKKIWLMPTMQNYFGKMHRAILARLNGGLKLKSIVVDLSKRNHDVVKWEWE